MNWISALFYLAVIFCALRWRWTGALGSAAIAAGAVWLLVLRGGAASDNLNGWLDVPLFFGCGALTVALGGQANLAIAFRDAETGLPNEAWLREKLGDELRRASRDISDSASSLLIIGIDGERGEASARDEKLRIVAETIRGAIRAADLAARLDNQEFATLLPETDAAGARIVAERIRRVVEENYTYFTISVGAVETESGQSAETLLQCADEAMFEARRLGGNRVVFYDAEMHGA